MRFRRNVHLTMNTTDNKNDEAKYLCPTFRGRRRRLEHGESKYNDTSDWTKTLSIKRVLINNNFRRNEDIAIITMQILGEYEYAN